MRLDINFRQDNLSFTPQFIPDPGIFQPGFGQTSHQELIGRNQPDQHPISAISQLTETLAQKIGIDTTEEIVLYCGTATEVV